MPRWGVSPIVQQVVRIADGARSRPRGENWLSILKELARNQEVKDDLVCGLKALTGDIEDVQVRSVASHLIAEFRQQPKTVKEKRWFDASQQSDGTLRVAGLLTALLQEPSLPVIGIEEPELTVHPGTLPILRDHWKQASENSQILVTSEFPIRRRWGHRSLVTAKGSWLVEGHGEVAAAGNLVTRLSEALTPWMPWASPLIASMISVFLLGMGTGGRPRGA